MTFSTILYRVPGPHHGPHGKTYDYKGASSEEEVAELLKEGWHECLEDACGCGSVSAPEEEIDEEIEAEEAEGVDEVSPPTRDELKAKAKELGIKHAKNIRDDKLLEMIEEALEKGSD